VRAKKPFTEGSDLSEKQIIHRLPMAPMGTSELGEVYFAMQPPIKIPETAVIAVNAYMMVEKTQEVDCEFFVITSESQQKVARFVTAIEGSKTINKVCLSVVTLKLDGPVTCIKWGIIMGAKRSVILPEHTAPKHSVENLWIDVYDTAL